MTESESPFVTSNDLEYFVKQISQGNLFSAVELQDIAGQVVWSVKENKSVFPPVPTPLAEGTIEVDYDGENNKVLLASQSQDETPADNDVVVIIPQTPPPESPKRKSILRSPSSSTPKRSRVFWKKNNKSSTVAAF